MSEVYAVTLQFVDGRTERIAVPAGETIVDAAESAEVGLPYGCLTGACGTCTAELLDGSVRHIRPPRALKRRHLEDDYVLACVATPETDCRIRVGADVAAELVEDPWR